MNVVEPMTHHVIMAYNGRCATHGAAFGTICFDWNVSFPGS